MLNTAPALGSTWMADTVEISAVLCPPETLTEDCPPETNTLAVLAVENVTGNEAAPFGSTWIADAVEISAVELPPATTTFTVLFVSERTNTGALLEPPIPVVLKETADVEITGSGFAVETGVAAPSAPYSILEYGW